MVHIAVIGCSHGEIDKIYETIGYAEQEQGIKVELVLCCGDFQSVRNMTDLRCMACPIKYQAMHDFHRYYSGEKQAPIPTIFIGGNHEASNFLQELPYGGWVAPNIYFCGNANVLKFGPLRIATISGIFKGHDYLKGRYECPPYDQNSMRSTYHYRNLDVFRLKQIKSPVDIALSHDWPRGIYNYGNVHELLRRKPFFRDEVQRNELGSRPLHEILIQLQPKHWFSAHMHVQFSAVVPHEPNPDPDADPSEAKVTHFLALDKVLPRRHFLQILEIPTPPPAADSSNGTNEMRLSYDPEWLAVLKSTDHLNNVKPKPCFMPGPGCGSRFDFTPSQDEIDQVSKLFANEFQVPNNFVQTAPAFQSGEKPKTAYPITNPHTVEFCEKLGVTDPLTLLPTKPQPQRNDQNNSSSFIGSDNSRLSNTFQEYSPINVSSSMNYSSSFQNTSADATNPDEILLEDDEDPGDVLSASTPRSKLHLPPPKSTSTPSKPASADTEEEIPATAKELKLVESLFPADEALFVLDRTGDGSQAPAAPETEPELKRRRNEELFKALEGEDE